MLKLFVTASPTGPAKYSKFDSSPEDDKDVVSKTLAVKEKMDITSDTDSGTFVLICLCMNSIGFFIKVGELILHIDVASIMHMKFIDTESDVVLRASDEEELDVFDNLGPEDLEGFSPDTRARLIVLLSGTIYNHIQGRNWFNFGIRHEIS